MRESTVVADAGEELVLSGAPFGGPGHWMVTQVYRSPEPRVSEARYAVEWAAREACAVAAAAGLSAWLWRAQGGALELVERFGPVRAREGAWPV